MRLIDADAVDYENIMCSQEQLHWLNAIIEKQPTVDAVPVVHGRWINLGRNYYTVVSQCSECCAKYDFRSPYCPNCGADMRGAEDG